MKMFGVVLVCCYLVGCADGNNSLVLKESVNADFVIRQMYARWSSEWPKNKQFSQRVYLYQQDSLVKEEVWHEWMTSPGFLRIDFYETNSGNGMLFRNDSMYFYQQNRVVSAIEKTHYLLLLADDVFAQEPEITLKKLTKLGFRIDQGYATDSHFVVGALSEQDTLSSQFHVHRDSLFLTKVYMNENDVLSRVDMQNYTMIGSAPSETRVVFYTNGNLRMIEEYFNIVYPEFLHDTIYRIPK
jgi:hypothetical protein